MATEANTVAEVSTAAAAARLARATSHNYNTTIALARLVKATSHYVPHCNEPLPTARCDEYNQENAGKQQESLGKYVEGKRRKAEGVRT